MIPEAVTAASLDDLSFDKQTVIDTVKTNREKHKKEYEEAVLGYRQKMKEWAEEIYKTVFVSGEEPKNRNCPYPKPQHHLAEYDRLLKLLEMCTDTSLTLSHNEFDNFIMDKWDWSRGFATVTSMYADRIQADKLD